MDLDTDLDIDLDLDLDVDLGIEAEDPCLVSMGLQVAAEERHQVCTFSAEMLPDDEHLALSSTAAPLAPRTMEDFHVNSTKPVPHGHESLCKLSL